MPFFLFLIFVALGGLAHAEVALYYGSEQDGVITSGGDASLKRIGVVAVVDLDSTSDKVRVEMYLLSTPASKAGRAFDYRLRAPYNMTKRSLTAPQGGGTLYTSALTATGGGTTVEELIFLAGGNALVQTTGKAGSERRLPTSLSGQLLLLSTQSVTAGTAVGSNFALGLLLPQTQYENAGSRTATQAKADVEKALDGLGGNKLP